MLGDFWVENFPIFPIQKVPKNASKTLLWGPETIRKKYWVVFEIFLKTMFFRLFQKIKFEIFLLEKFPIFPIRKVPEDVLKSLLWGPKAIRKKYRVVFEIFLKSMFFSAFSENNVRQFLSGKISDFSNSESSKRCI